MRLLTFATLCTAVTAFAGDDLTPDQRAKLLNDQKKAGAAVEKKYGNKKASELSPDERRSMAKEKAEAENQVLDKAGVDPKEFARSTMKMGRDDKADTDAAQKKLEQQDKEAAAGGGKDGKDAKKGKKEIVIEKNGKVEGAEVNEAAEMDKAAGLGKGKK